MKIDKKLILKISVAAFLLFLAVFYWDNFISFAIKLAGTAVPLIVGAALAYIINIPMSFLERHYFPNSKKKFVIYSRKWVCMMISVIMILLLIFFVSFMVFPQLIDCLILAVNLLPGEIQKLIDYVDSFHILPEDIISVLESIDWKSSFGTIIDTLTTGFGNVVTVVFKALTTVFSYVVTTIVAIIFAFYILMSKNKLQKQAKRLLGHYLKSSWNNNIYYFFRVINESFRKFIVGQSTEALILGILCTIGMLIFNFPYPSMIGALIGFTALIPIAGAYIGVIVGAFMILTVSPIQALFFIIFIIVLQQLEGNLIYPKVVGSSIGLPGLWVLASVTIGGGMFGIPGMVIGVPLTAAAYRFIKEDMKRPSHCVCAAENKAADADGETAAKDDGAGSITTENDAKSNE